MTADYATYTYNTPGFPGVQLKWDEARGQVTEDGGRIVVNGIISGKMTMREGRSAALASFDRFTHQMFGNNEEVQG